MSSETEQAAVVQPPPPMCIRRIVIVGSGSSSSTPMLNCIANGKPCAQCKEALEVGPSCKNHRLNPCLLIQASPVDRPPNQEPEKRPKTPPKETADPEAKKKAEEEEESVVKNILIDCGKTFRESGFKVLIPNQVSRLAAVILTHGHADACYGLDDLREFSGRSYEKKRPIEILADKATMDTCRNVYPYLFSTGATWVAAVTWREFVPNTPFQLLGLPSVMPVPVEHGKNYFSNAFVFPLKHETQLKKEGEQGQEQQQSYFVYISDVSSVPDETMAYLQSLPVIDVLVLDMLGYLSYPTHLTVDQSIKLASQFKVRKMVSFVGQGHGINYDALAKRFEDEGRSNWQVGFDGLVVYDDGTMSSPSPAATASA